MAAAHCNAGGKPPAPNQTTKQTLELTLAAGGPTPKVWQRQVEDVDLLLATQMVLAPLLCALEWLGAANHYQAQCTTRAFPADATGQAPAQSHQG